MSYASEPISLTIQAALPGQYAPEPIAVIGGLPAATNALPGGVLKGAAVANATVATDGTSAGTQLNALLVSLRNAGVIA